MSAGRDKKAKTNERKAQVSRAVKKREATRTAMLERRVVKRAKRATLKARNRP